ncbi:MAG: hypothetical protein PWQ41_1071 [Bacillota bacterium]|nr:hypothetical protein [Bacillota bacterium]MDK2925297.1 hypothetical protein [Bacillota bacterium]MDK2960507.1 hypothetical protein [Bacillota bacterium]
MAQRENKVLVSKPFSARVLLPSLPNMELLACGAELGRPHFHLISNSKGLAFGKLELVACYAKVSNPGEYQLTTVSRNYVLELDMEENEKLIDAGNGRAIWAEFRKEPCCQVCEACTPGGNKAISPPKNVSTVFRKRLEVEVSSVLEILTASDGEELPGEVEAREKAMDLPASPTSEEQSEDPAVRLGSGQDGLPRAACVPVVELEETARHMVNVPVWVGPHPEPKLTAGEKPNGLFCKPDSPQEPTRPISRIPPGAETVPPYVWRMPGRG